MNQFLESETPPCVLTVFLKDPAQLSWPQICTPNENYVWKPTVLAALPMGGSMRKSRGPWMKSVVSLKMTVVDPVVPPGEEKTFEI